MDNDNSGNDILSSDKNFYFIEDVADKDLIGINNYVLSIDNAINNNAKFIGLISDYGVGKSTIISKLKDKHLSDKNYSIFTINLWNCDNFNSKINIHKMFLYGLIDKLIKGNKKYYKRRIHKNYSLFDIVFKKNIAFYLICLIIFICFGFFNIYGFYRFSSYENKILYYFIVSVYAGLIIAISKGILLSFNKDKTSNNIDENDTKDLYYEIWNDYGKHNKNKKLIICLEELDRYEDSDEILKILKEFYKFYKRNEKDKYNNSITFIISIKAASNIDNEDINNTKELYEKIFDYIININPIYIDNYNNITYNLIKDKLNDNDIPESIIKLIPKYDYEMDLTAWKYLYKGNNIKIRDIKNRYNYAISLYFSAQESGLCNCNFDTCLYLSYLEDEYNELYNFLVKEKNILNDVILSYARKEYDLKNILKDNKINEELIDTYNNVLIEGLNNKYISLDYKYYFFKYPSNKKSYNLYETSLLNAIYFDIDSGNLNFVINNLSDEQILYFIKKRNNDSLLPNIIFKYPKLLNLAYLNESNVFRNTILQNYDITNDYDNFTKYLSYIKNVDYNKLLDEYFKIHFDNIKKLSPIERFNLRIKIVKDIKEKSLIIKNLFFYDNELISPEEIKDINNIKIIFDLINFSKVNDITINRIARIINTGSKQTIIKYLKATYKNTLISDDSYQRLFYSIDFKAHSYIDKEIRYMFNYSVDRLKLNNKSNFNRFINKVNYYDEFYDDYYLDNLNFENKDEVKGYINTLNRYNKIYIHSMNVLSRIDTFIFNERIRNEFYKNNFYEYYIKTTLLSTKVYDIEVDKFDILFQRYIDIFKDTTNWNYNVTKQMKNFLYNNIDFNILSISQLSIFNDLEQSYNIIYAVINTNDESFINKYLSKVNKINKKDEEKIYNLIGNYHTKNKCIKYTARINLKKLTNKKKCKDMLDARRKIINIL